MQYERKRSGKRSWIKIKILFTVRKEREKEEWEKLKGEEEDKHTN